MDRTRRFEPSLRYGDSIDLNLIQIPSDNGDWTYVACDDDPCGDCGHIEAHLDSIFIAVDSACRGNGQANAKAAIGVFFGETSKYNRSVLLSEPDVTNQIAELRAGVLALELAKIILQTKALGDERPLDTVVIKADSEYLVKGMTEWVLKWETNGYKSANRKPVKNSKVFQELHALTKELNTSNVEVLFWQVPREMNKEADKLANKAF